MDKIQAIFRWLSDLITGFIGEIGQIIGSIIRHPVKRMVALMFPIAAIRGDIDFDRLDPNWIWVILIVVGADIANTVLRKWGR